MATKRSPTFDRCIDARDGLQKVHSFWKPRKTNPGVPEKLVRLEDDNFSLLNWPPFFPQHSFVFEGVSKRNFQVTWFDNV